MVPRGAWAVPDMVSVMNGKEYRARAILYSSSASTSNDQRHQAIFQGLEKLYLQLAKSADEVGSGAARRAKN